VSRFSVAIGLPTTSVAASFIAVTAASSCGALASITTTVPARRDLTRQQRQRAVLPDHQIDHRDIWAPSFEAGNEVGALRKCRLKSLEPEEHAQALAGCRIAVDYMNQTVFVEDGMVVFRGTSTSEIQLECIFTQFYPHRL